MKTSTILISPCIFLMVCCTSNRKSAIQPSLENDSNLTEGISDLLEDSLIHAATTETSFTDTLACLPIEDPWKIIPPGYPPYIPPYYPPWGITWVWGFSIIYVVNAREEAQNDRTYTHLIVDRNCLVVERSNKHLYFELDMSEEKTFSCSIENIQIGKSLIRASPYWLNTPIRVKMGVHKFSIPYASDFRLNYRATISSETDSKNITLRF